jgi:hypothetical protein
METEHEKIGLVKTYLEDSFMNVETESSETDPRFVCSDGRSSYELVFDRTYLDDLDDVSKLKHRLEVSIIPALTKNPEKRVHVGAKGFHIARKKDSPVATPMVRQTIGDRQSGKSPDCPLCRSPSRVHAAVRTLQQGIGTGHSEERLWQCFGCQHEWPQ